MANQIQNMYANSTVPCSVILVADATHNNSVKTSVNGTVRPVGISGNANRTRPDPDFTLQTQAQQIAAIAGEAVLVFVEGATGVDLYCNYAWAAGELIMADSNGAGTVATTGTYYVGQAQTPGVVGSLCPVDVKIGYRA